MIERKKRDEMFTVCKCPESRSIYACAENRRQCPRRSNIYLYLIWHGGIENATFDIPYLRLGEKKGKKRWRCLINCCLDKSRRGMVEDDADDRSIMPQRRLEKPTIERQSCHSILQNGRFVRHTKGCHSVTRQGKMK